MGYQQNKIAYVTGASSGIGEALVTKLLDEGYFVTGLSRTVVNRGDNYEHHSIDLSDIEAVASFEFSQHANHVLLINNAGSIGAIKPIGQNPISSLVEVSNLNALAPQILINNFLKTFSGKVESGQILNISSGAGKYPIDSWAPYCASKASLDLFSETVKAELTARGQENWYVHSVAPGVVDTTMQEVIRSANPEDFMALQKFIDLKANNELSIPKAVAYQLNKVIANPQNYKDVVISVRDFNK